MEQQFSGLDRVMEPETISKNEESLKSLMSRGNAKFLSADVKIFLAMLVFAVMLISCGGGKTSTPLGICDIFYKAIAKKDYKTAAKYHISTIYTDDEKLYNIEQAWMYLSATWMYELKNEQISDDGKKATVTAIFKLKSEDYEEEISKEIRLIKTESDDWMLENY